MMGKYPRAPLNVFCRIARGFSGKLYHSRLLTRNRSTSSNNNNAQLQPQSIQSRQPRTLTYDEIVELQNTPTPPLKARDTAKDPPILTIFFASMLGIPPLVYYYWQYRKEHMKQKKYAMLKDIQARAGKAA